jgi:hypothetical protein
MIARQGKILRVHRSIGEESMGSSPYGLEGRVRARLREAKAFAAGTPMDGLHFAFPANINPRFSTHCD